MPGLKTHPGQDKGKVWQEGVKSKGEEALLSGKTFQSKGFLKQKPFEILSLKTKP